MERRTVEGVRGGESLPAEVNRRAGGERRQAVLAQMQMRSGPLPDAEELAKYEAVIVGSGQIIVNKFAEQSDHRRVMEAVVIRGNDRRADRGQWMAFTLGMVAIVGGIFLAYTGRETAGLVAVVGALGTLLSLFIYGQISQRKEMAGKAKAARD